MYKIVMELEKFHKAAKENPELREKLLATRNADDPLDAFCIIAKASGYNIPLGELFELGQEFNDNQCKSTNGGNPRPNECYEDVYDTFLASL